MNSKSFGTILLLLAVPVGAIALYLKQDSYLVLCILVALFASRLVRDALIGTQRQNSKMLKWMFWFLMCIPFLIVARLAFIRGLDWLTISSFCGFIACLFLGFLTLALPAARNFVGNLRKIFGSK
jgi:hypothetical protein